MEFAKRIIVIGVFAGLGALAIYIASETNNIIATRDKSILLIMPGLPVVFTLIVLSLLGWRRYFMHSNILLFLLCLFIVGVAVFESMSTRDFYNLIKSVSPDFSIGSGGGHALELRVMGALANTMGALYILSIGTLVFFVGDGAYRAWNTPVGNERAQPDGSPPPVLAGGHGGEARRVLPWHYWLISVLALCWFGLGLASFVANLFLGTFWRDTSESGVLPPAAPIWLLAAIFAANIGGFLGALFLLFKNRNAAGCFLVCLLTALVLLAHQLQLMRSHDMFSAPVFLIGVFTGVCVPAFLLWYTLRVLPKPSLALEPSANAEPAMLREEQAHGSHPTYDSPENTCGFLVFDHNQMSSEYGEEVFSAIYQALRMSSGLCAFHDGDVFDIRKVETLARKAAVVMPATGISPLANQDARFEFGAYVAAMFTDTYANFDRVHDALRAGGVEGYLGLVVVSGRLGSDRAMELFVDQLGLPGNLVLRDGSAVPGTDRYRVART